jgi:hypothetical protein
MDDSDHRDDRAAVSDLHPVVYMALIGFVLWLLIAVWSFARDSLSAYLMVIVIGFITLFVAIPVTLLAMARSHREPTEGDDSEPAERAPFRQWAAGEFDTWQDRVKGSKAAVEVLLPIAALAIGMTAFAVVAHYTLPAGV